MRAASAFSTSYPAVPASVAKVRARVGDLASQAGAAASTVHAVKLAVSEATTNIVMHAYREAGRPGLIYVEARLDAGELHVSVADTGTGLRQNDESPGLGLGLAIIGQLAGNVELLQGPNGGVTVLMRFTLAGTPITT